MNKKRADLQESNQEANGMSMQLVDNYGFFVSSIFKVAPAFEVASLLCAGGNIEHG